MYKVFQIQISEFIYDYVNANGHLAAELRYPEYHAYLETSRGAEKYVEDFSECYTHVANVEADSEEQVFRLMNVWGEESEEQVEVFDRARSLSVGDVVVNTLTGDAKMVNKFGFADIEFA